MACTLRYKHFVLSINTCKRYGYVLSMPRLRLFLLSVLSTVSQVIFGCFVLYT